MDFSLEFVGDFLRTVRQQSSYYGELWKDVLEGVSSVEDLPITELEGYWAAAKDGTLLTRKQFDGIIVRTGGTTSAPRVVYTAREEMAATAGAACAAFTSIRPGDRIANLFHVGGMYSGFAMMTVALWHIPTPHVHLPITGNESIAEQANFIRLFEATVILSNVFTVCRIVDHLTEAAQTIESVRLVLFIGEMFYEDLRASWRKAFPNLEVRPLMYGATDGSIIGVPVNDPGQLDQDIKPLYRVSPNSVVVEIVDDEGKVIREPGRTGRLLVTDFERRLHPVVRYPLGDVGQWVDYGRKHFKLLGRETVALKVVSLFLGLPKLRKIVSEVLGTGLVNSFLCVVRRAEGKNEVTFRIATSVEHPSDATPALEQGLIATYPKWGDLLKAGYIQPLRTEWVQTKDLVFSEKSGKLREIIEARYEYPLPKDQKCG